MIISNDKIKTADVLNWKGLHLLHFHGSSCSQKVRIILGELALNWTAHSINLMKHENSTEWFIGINPRGVVPVLVHDGVVHVESNDIITYLDSQYAKPGESYFFSDSDPNAEVAKTLLDIEGGLHTDLRLLTIQFGPLSIKKKEQIDTKAKNGIFDEKRESEVQWWLDKAENGINETEVQAACQRFNDIFSQLDQRLASSPWLVGKTISIVDISWFVNIQRLNRLGYPLKRHKHLYEYYNKLCARPAFIADSKLLPARIGKIVFSFIRLKNRLTNNRMEKLLKIM